MIIRVVGFLGLCPRDFVNSGKDLRSQLFGRTRSGQILFQLRDFGCSQDHRTHIRILQTPGDR
jgi:hypothetical protein